MSNETSQSKSFETFRNPWKRGAAFGSTRRVSRAPNGAYLWGLRWATPRNKKEDEERRTRKRRSPNALVRFAPRSGASRKEARRSKRGGKPHESVGMFLGNVAREVACKSWKALFSNAPPINRGPRSTFWKLRAPPSGRLSCAVNIASLQRGGFKCTREATHIKERSHCAGVAPVFGAPSSGAIHAILQKCEGAREEVFLSVFA